MRYRLTIEYDGTPFAGWQRQANGYAVQQALEEAATRFDGGKSLCVGAGRTDAGVHALGQVAHMDLRKAWEGAQLARAFNFHLSPRPVAVLDAQPVKPDFHARFDARARIYRYRILARRAPPVLDRLRLWHRPFALDVEAMRAAAVHLVGRHDFTSFRDSACQADSPVKTLDTLDVEAVEGEIHVVAQARSFLHRQVRSMVGVLERVGAGKWKAERAKAALEARDRSCCAAVAPACGLYLLAVRYGA